MPQSNTFTPPLPAPPASSHGPPSVEAPLWTQWLRRLPALVVALLVSGVTLLEWQALLQQQQRTIREATQAAARQVTNEVRARIDVRLQALTRLGRRWDISGRPPPEVWEADVMSYLRDFPGIQAINWADASLQLRWVTPLAGNEAALGIDVRTSPAWPTQRQAQEQRTVLLSPTFELRQGGRGFIICVPLFPQDTFDGFINGVFRVQPLLALVLADIAPGYEVALFENTEELYRRSPSSYSSLPTYVHETAVSLPGVTWRVHVWPGPAVLVQQQGPLTRVLLGLGLILAGALSLTVLLAQTARQRAQEALAANRQLDLLNVDLERRVHERTATLQERDNQLQLSLQAARMGTWEWECTTNTVVWSPQAEALCGVAAGTFPGTYDAVLARIHPEDRERFRQLETVTQQLRQPDYEQEVRVVWPDTTVHWLLTKGHIEYNDQQQAVRVRGVLIDITARKQAEEELANSEQRWRTLAEALPALVWMSRPDGFLDYYNPRWTDLTGLSAEQLAGWGWQAVWHPDDLPGGRAQWQKSLRTGQPYEYQARFLCAADKSYRWQLIRAVPIHNTAGKILRWFGTTIDIEDQKRAEFALLESEERLHLALEAGRLGTWELDTVTGRNWFSPETEVLWGFAPGTFPGTWDAFVATIYPDDQARVQQVYQQIATRHAAESSTFRLEYRIVRPNGAIRWMEVVGRPFATIHNGPETGARGVVIDITERKAAEVEQERLLGELQRINAELQQFSYIVSHDLKEPLRNITALVTFLNEDYHGQLDAKADDYLTRIVAATERLQQMLTDLLAYTRIGQTPEFHAVNCEDVLADVLGALTVQITESEAVVTHDTLPTVRGNATRLGQVLQNLIGNALKFRRVEVSPQVHISARREGGYWTFCVRDNGIGIDPQQAGRLFQVFQRLHPRSMYPGSGIGLAICKRIVEQHGGRIWVTSTPGEGSTFYFTIRAEPIIS